MNDSTLVRAYFGGVSEGDYFPKGKRQGIYIPDWDSEFVIKPYGRSLLKSNRIITKLLAPYSIKARAVRVLVFMNLNKNMHEIQDILGNRYVNRPFSNLTGEYIESHEFTLTVTWLLRNNYITRVIDRSIE